MPDSLVQGEFISEGAEKEERKTLHRTESELAEATRHMSDAPPPPLKIAKEKRKCDTVTRFPVTDLKRLLEIE